MVLVPLHLLPDGQIAPFGQGDASAGPAPEVLEVSPFRPDRKAEDIFAAAEFAHRKKHWRSIKYPQEFGNLARQSL